MTVKWDPKRKRWEEIWKQISLTDKTKQCGHEKHTNVLRNVTCEKLLFAGGLLPNVSGARGTGVKSTAGFHRPSAEGSAGEAPAREEGAASPPSEETVERDNISPNKKAAALPGSRLLLCFQWEKSFSRNQVCWALVYRLRW